MKKLFSMLFIVTLLGLVFTACGNDKDEPEAPKAQNLESVHEQDEHYFVFDIDMNKDKSTIYMYQIQFAPGAPSMDLRVNVPASFNQSSNVYTLTGTGLVAERYVKSMESDNKWVPMPGDQYKLNDLMCTVNPSAKQYSISFTAHGGKFEESGKLK
ncbi:MAG: hypothetical protein IKI10_03010 [Muribaculaceae bacterium]|nr:hypothetical protein [Muribaculaceae bacterium]